MKSADAALPTPRWIERSGAALGICTGLTVVLIASMVLATSIGGAQVSLPDALRYLGSAISGGHIDRAELASYQIVWQVRSPRTLVAAIAGAGLAAAGVVMQAIVRNVLADPFLLGISSGASVGAVAVTVGATGLSSFGVSLLGSGLGTLAIVVGAFAGALSASVLVWFTARRRDEGVTPIRLVLTGVVLAAGFQAVMSVLIYLVPDTESTATVLFWSMGSFGAAGWPLLGPMAVIVAVAVLAFLIRSRTLDVLSFGDEAAAGLGIDASRARRSFFVIVSVATAAVTAVCGAVGFVGLIVPHIVRMCVGASHHRVLLIAPLAGAVFMVWVDVLARSLVAPRELPLTSITALIGVPIFIALLRRRSRVLGA